MVLRVEEPEARIELKIKELGKCRGAKNRGPRT